MMGKHPTPPQKVNEKSVWCIFTDDGLVGVNYSGASDRDVTHAGEVVAVQASPGQASPVQSRPGQEGNAAKLGAKLPDTHADAHKKKGRCDRSANGAADPADPSWKNTFFKNFFFTSGW